MAIVAVGIDLSAETDGMTTMRRSVDKMMADYETAASKCREMGR